MDEIIALWAIIGTTYVMAIMAGLVMGMQTQIDFKKTEKANIIIVGYLVCIIIGLIVGTII